MSSSFSLLFAGSPVMRFHAVNSGSNDDVWGGWGGVVLIVTILILVIGLTGLIILRGMKKGEMQMAAAAQNEHDDLFRSYAERTANNQERMALQQEKVADELVTINTRLASIEKLLKEVE